MSADERWDDPLGGCMTPREREAVKVWRPWLAEPQAPLSGGRMLARAKARLRAFCFGDDPDAAKSPDWPLSPAQEEAVAAASRAHSGPKRLRAVADLLEASAPFEWFSSIESCVKAGVDPGDRFFRAFHRIDLADGTYCGPNIGIAGPSSANPLAGGSGFIDIPGWSGRRPSALALDAKGWAAVLWGSPRNVWKWWSTWMLDIDDASIRLKKDWVREGLHSPEAVAVGAGWVGTAQFTLLRGFDGGNVNVAAGRIFGLSPERTQWLGGAAGLAGPYCDNNLTGAHLAEICRAAAEGAHPKEVWATLSEGVRRLRFDPVPYPPPPGAYWAANNVSTGPMGEAGHGGEG